MLVSGTEIVSTGGTLEFIGVDASHAFRDILSGGTGELRVRCLHHRRQQRRHRQGRHRGDLVGRHRKLGDDLVLGHPHLDSGGVIGVGVNVSSGGTVELIGVNLNSAGAEFNFSTNAIIELGSGAVYSGELVKNDATLKILAGGTDSRGTVVSSGSLLESCPADWRASGHSKRRQGDRLRRGHRYRRHYQQRRHRDRFRGGTGIVTTLIASGGIFVTASGGTAIVSGAVTDWAR